MNNIIWDIRVMLTYDSNQTLTKCVYRDIGGKVSIEVKFVMSDSLDSKLDHLHSLNESTYFLLRKS